MNRTAIISMIGCSILTAGCGGEKSKAPPPAAAQKSTAQADPWRESRISAEILKAQEGRPTTREVWYAYCVDARADGVAPIKRGRPGYRLDLDMDRDGLACEPGER